MSIKPIDMQTNISQMLEVGRNEHAKTGAIAEQQQILDKEAAEQSKLIDSKLDEMKKGEKTAIRDEESKKKKKQEQKEKKEKRLAGKKKEKSIVHDGKIGTIIDIRK